MPAAKVPPAPARFSTTNGCPNSCDSACAKGRATISVVPPGAKGTISVTGLLGHTCAKASLAASVNKMHKDPNRRTTILIGARLEVRRDAFSRRASRANDGPPGERARTIAMRFHEYCTEIRAFAF